LRVTVLHERVAADARADQLDVLDQVRVVTASLQRSGHRSDTLACGLDLDDMVTELRRRAPDVVFNLVESIDGHGRLVHLVPAVLQSIGLPVTGAPAAATFFAASKLLSKRLLVAAGLPTPPWLAIDDPTSPLAVAGTWPVDRFVVKSVWEHGSHGLETDCVFEATDADQLRAAIERLGERLGGEAMAERYVHGREFNLALLAAGEGCQVLTPAEIEFCQDDPTAPRIVGWRSKWQPDSAEYGATERAFPSAAADRPLLAELTDLAHRAWQTFGTRGYARVDFRVDAEGRPTNLEINVNPCLAPDAGFVAAAERAGLGFDALIGAIVSTARERRQEAA
jgi:D-alanine-D-alanine ligase